MVMPNELQQPNAINARLVTKTSIPEPKKAAGLFMLLWYASNKPAKVEYGLNEGKSADGGIASPELAKTLTGYLRTQNLNYSEETTLELLRSNPLCTSQIEALDSLFALIWHLGIFRFVSNERNNSAERKGGIRYRKTVSFASNVDLIDILATKQEDAFAAIMCNWMGYETAQADAVLESQVINMLTIFAETSFYKSAKGAEGIVYTPSGVYEQLIDNETVELVNEAEEAQGTTRIFKSIVKDGLNSMLSAKSNNSVVLAAERNVKEVENYTKRAKSTIALSKIEINLQEKADQPQEMYSVESRNLIYFGAPGTGKSYQLNKAANEKFDKDKIRRVTFHPDYTYAQFVGSFRPHTDQDERGKTQVYYAYTPGPFIETYVEAVKNPDKDYLFIIEEINRANPAAVFGDIFQLLDRDAEGNSDYPIKTSDELRQYLENEFIALRDKEEKTTQLSIPPNLYIWATMNSADQGVFPMDTAFKRRWGFRYMGIDDGDSVIQDIIVPLGNTGNHARWNDFRKEINRILLDARVNEDKLLGPFFIDPDLLDDESFTDTFKSKVLLYLIEDAAKTKKEKVFGQGAVTYSIVSGNFEEEGEQIFKGIADITIKATDENDNVENAEDNTSE